MNIRKFLLRAGCLLGCAAMLMTAVGSESRAAGGAARATADGVPANVYVLDAMTLTIVLPRNGMLRNVSARIWLEMTDPIHAATIERNKPKIINGFLRDFQRHFYRDTERRAALPEDQRGYVYHAPALIPPPAPVEGAEEKEDSPEENGAVTSAPVSPFAPTTDVDIARLQARLLAGLQTILGPNMVTSVQIRTIQDRWPAAIQ
ncbi:hypothetical protein [Thalassospira sp.]|uniref:hypothetical protein n=1 Tax=Thalassospira sp. TaxID=1912094 RepID=UPI00273262B3|nr:hypothetical protein [Thalassospira sp.]MDP2698995.1 hypothetical protein [Thalassospira sp.]